jgi:hypothetical protein
MTPRLKRHFSTYFLAFSLALMTFGLTGLFISYGPRLEGRWAILTVMVLLTSAGVAAVSLIVAISPVLAHYLAGKMNETEDDPE